MSTTETTAPAGRPLVRTRHPGIFKRGDRYVVRLRDPSGKQRQRAARTLAEARRLRSELAADRRRGEYRPDTKVTLSAYAATWRETYSGRTARGLRSETLREYRRDLEPAIERLGRKRLAEITPADVKDYARALEAQGLKPATIRRRLAPLKALLATAVEDGLLRANPTAGVRIGSSVTDDREDEEQVKALTLEELGRLVDEVPEGWRRLLVATLAQTGLRISEGLGLRWSDVDSKRGRLHVRRRVRDGEVGRAQEPPGPSRGADRARPSPASSPRIGSPRRGRPTTTTCSPPRSAGRSWRATSTAGSPRRPSAPGWGGPASTRSVTRPRALAAGGRDDRPGFAPARPRRSGVHAARLRLRPADGPSDRRGAGSRPSGSTDGKRPPRSGEIRLPGESDRVKRAVLGTLHPTREPPRCQQLIQAAGPVRRYPGPHVCRYGLPCIKVCHSVDVRSRGTRAHTWSRTVRRSRDQSTESTSSRLGSSPKATSVRPEGEKTTPSGRPCEMVSPR